MGMSVFAQAGPMDIHTVLDIPGIPGSDFGLVNGDRGITSHTHTAPGMDGGASGKAVVLSPIGTKEGIGAGARIIFCVPPGGHVNIGIDHIVAAAECIQSDGIVIHGYIAGKIAVAAGDQPYFLSGIDAGFCGAVAADAKNLIRPDGTCVIAAVAYSSDLRVGGAVCRQVAQENAIRTAGTCDTGKVIGDNLDITGEAASLTIAQTVGGGTCAGFGAGDTGGNISLKYAIAGINGPAGVAAGFGILGDISHIQAPPAIHHAVVAGGTALAVVVTPEYGVGGLAQTAGVGTAVDGRKVIFQFYTLAFECAGKLRAAIPDLHRSGEITALAVIQQTCPAVYILGTRIALDGNVVFQIVEAAVTIQLEIQVGGNKLQVLAGNGVLCLVKLIHLGDSAFQMHIAVQLAVIGRRTGQAPVFQLGIRRQPHIHVHVCPAAGDAAVCSETAGCEAVQIQFCLGTAAGDGNGTLHINTGDGGAIVMPAAEGRYGVTHLLVGDRQLKIRVEGQIGDLRAGQHEKQTVLIPSGVTQGIADGVAVAVQRTVKPPVGLHAQGGGHLAQIQIRFQPVAGIGIVHHGIEVLFIFDEVHHVRRRNRNRRHQGKHHGQAQQEATQPRISTFHSISPFGKNI